MSSLHRQRAYSVFQLLYNSIQSHTLRFSSSLCSGEAKHQGAVNLALKNTALLSRTTRSISDSASISGVRD